MSETVASAVKRWPMRRSFDYLKREYHQAVIASGGIPILLPNIKESDLIKSLLGTIDGLLLTGGGDLDPKFYGAKPHKSLTVLTENRDAFELEIIKRALEKNMPMLGICRGHQALNVVLGGTLHQDLSLLTGKILKHSDKGQTGAVFHKVVIESKSILHRIIGQETIETNSSHHQVVDKPGQGLRISAYASDGLIEGLEHHEYDFVVSVQWHPEGIYRRTHSKRLFDALIEAASSKNRL